jgi:gas vesicle protein
MVFGGNDMEVTLEKIELVKDRTGVTYKEAKEALEAADGNVVDAIVAIEEKTDGQTSSEKIGNKGTELLDKMKDIVRRGNVARIVIKKDEDTLLNLPLNAGVIGAVVAPWGIILGVAASFGFNCKIEFITDEGDTIDITDKAGNIYETAKEKGNEMYEQVKEKYPEVYDQVKEKGEAAVNKAKEFADEAKEKIKMGKNKAEEAVEDIDDAAEEAKDAAEDAASDAEETVADGTVDLSDIKDSDL